MSDVLKNVSHISACPKQKYHLVVHCYSLICIQVPGNSNEVGQQVGVLDHIPDMTMMAVNTSKCNLYKYKIL